MRNDDDAVMRNHDDAVMRNDDAVKHNDDAVMYLILSCAFLCRHCWVYYVITALLESPQVLIAEEEKIIVEEVKGDQTVVEEK